MPSNLKKMVRARMEKTGESHQQALRHIRGGRSGDGGLEAVIRRLVSLATARREESQTDNPRLGLTIPMNAETEAYLNRPRPADDALRFALNELDLGTLRKIEAVMYAGREHEDVLITYRHLPKDDRLVTAHMIASKLPLAEYLTDGLQLVWEQGIDLDSAW